MPTSPNSLTITATRLPCAVVRMRLSKVVFPAPKNPVRTVTGTSGITSVVIKTSIGKTTQVIPQYSHRPQEKVRTVLLDEEQPNPLSACAAGGANRHLPDLPVHRARDITQRQKDKTVK